MSKRSRRGARTGKRRRPRKPLPEAPPAPLVHQHPRFGAVPLLEHTWEDASGRTYAGYRFDPDHAPPLPEGAVRGNVRRQTGLGAFDVPSYFFVDEPRRCVQCRADFVFSAREQKHWYETLQFNFASVAIRCAPCRRQRRSDKALHHAVEDARRQVADAPDHPASQLALAEAIVALRDRKARGNPDHAIAAARKARHLLKDRPARAKAMTHFWEGCGQAMAGRSSKARQAYEAFLADAGGKAHRRFIRRAEGFLADAS